MKRFKDFENEDYLEEYRKRMKKHIYTEEELYEMRSAFGEETPYVVDVITGERVYLF